MVQAAMRRYNGITNKEDRGMGMTKEEILVHVDHTLLKGSLSLGRDTDTL